MKIGNFPFREDRVVCIDTETTGLDENAEIVQLSAVGIGLDVKFNELIKPTCVIPSEATAIHGITNEMVKNQKTIKYWWDFVSGNILSSKIVLGYNVQYDIRMLMQSISKFGLSNTRGFSPIMVIDVMQIFQLAFNKTKWVRLEEACNFLGVTSDNSSFHNSLYDCIMTMKLWNELSRVNHGMKAEI